MRRLDAKRDDRGGAWGRFARAMGRLARDRAADTAVEFALIGTAFFVFVFAIFVVGINQFMQLTLDEATRNAARQVQTNQAPTALAFKTSLCAEFGPVAPSCMTALQYDVQQGTTFNAMTPATLKATGLSVTAQYPNETGGYLPGSSDTTTPSPEFLLVQVAYPVPFGLSLIPGGGFGTENGTGYVYSAVAVDMEPGP